MFTDPLDRVYAKWYVPFEFKLNSFYTEIWPFGWQCWSLAQGVIELFVTFAFRVDKHGWEKCIWHSNWSESKCIEDENWNSPCATTQNTICTYVCLPINQNLPVNCCIPIWLSTFDSQNGSGKERNRDEKQQSKLLTYVKHVVQMNTFFSRLAITHWTGDFYASQRRGFWIKQMHRRNMIWKFLSSLLLLLLFDLDCLLSWACQSP